MRMRHWIVVVAVVGVAACVPAVSRADTTVIHGPLTVTIGDMCGADGESVTATGHVNIVDTFVDLGNSVYHEMQIAQVHLTGVGDISGDRYVYNASGQLSELTFDNRPALVIDTTNAVMIHAGETTPLDDFYLRMSLHPPGQWYVDESGCR